MPSGLVLVPSSSATSLPHVVARTLRDAMSRPRLCILLHLHSKAPAMTSVATSARSRPTPTPCSNTFPPLPSQASAPANAPTVPPAAGGSLGAAKPSMFILPRSRSRFALRFGLADRRRGSQRGQARVYVARPSRRWTRVQWRVISCRPPRSTGILFQDLSVYEGGP